MSGDIDGAIAKIRRAEAQIRELSGRVEVYSKFCGYEIVSTIDEERDEEVWRFQPVGSVPIEIPVVIGEALHNLRSSLDNIACAAAMRNKGNDSGTYFPFGADPIAFEEALGAKTKKLPEVARNIIREVRPYKGGNDLLWLVHHLNVSDKHRRVVPVRTRSSTNVASSVVIHRGLLLILGSRRGQHLYVVKPRPSAEEIARMPSPTGVYKLPPGDALSFGTGASSPEESLEFMVTTPGASFETDMKPAFDIAFAGVEGLGIESAVSTLTKMHREIARIAARFRATLFP